MRAGIVVDLTSEDRRRLEAIVSDRNPPAEACCPRQGHPGDRGWLWNHRDHPPLGIVQAGGLALAGTLHARGVPGLLRDKTRSPGKAPTAAAIVQRVVDLATADPPGETTHWTLRLMAKTIGIGASTVQRNWKAYGLQPHRIRRFKLSTAPSPACR